MQSNKIILKLLIATLFVSGIFIYAPKVRAYGECTQYGIMSMYDSLTDSCKCMSGYVFSTGLLGTPYCVSADQVCKEKYGYNARSDYSGGSCKCGYGYSFAKDSIGRTQCISEDDQCHDQLGYNSRYNSLRDVCECGYGYVISGGTCQYGNTVCRTEHGLYSDYNSLNNKCECDSGYTFDDSNQCVKKQNNAYFYLKEVDTDNKQAIIKSEFDYTYYLIKYGIGCYSSSIKRYLRNDIVVNLGTDFDLDTWDKIVLQDDNETCDITNVQRASSSTTLTPDDEPTYTYVPPTPIITPSPAPTNNNLASIQPKTCKEGQTLTLDKQKCVSIPVNSHPTLNSNKDIWKCNDGYKELGSSCIASLIQKQTTSTPENISVESKSQDKTNLITTNDKSANSGEEKKPGYVKRFFGGIGNFLKNIYNWFK